MYSCIALAIPYSGKWIHTQESDEGSGWVVVGKLGPHIRYFFHSEPRVCIRATGKVEEVGKKKK